MVKKKKKELKFLNQNVEISTTIVNGDCPKCDTYTVLVSIYNTVYRCMTCGYDLEQKINGKISYIPIINSNNQSKINLKGHTNEES